MTRWVGLVVVVLAVVGCATTWEGAGARMTRQTFNACREETGVSEAQLLWVAPDGIFRMRVPTPEGMQRMQSCMTMASGVRWTR